MALPDDKRERWALNANLRGSPQNIKFKTYTDMDRMTIEKSFAYGETAVFISVDNDRDEMMHTHLTADDAEGIGTVLLFLADKWRKENT